MKSSLVTLVIQHSVAFDVRPAYETWLGKIIPAAKKFAGHQGVEVARPQPGADRFTVLLRFDTPEHLRDWIDSPDRLALMAEIEPILMTDEILETTTGLEYLFDCPSSARKTPKPYKQFLVTLSAIYPLTVVVPWVCSPLFRIAPVLTLPVLSNLVISVIIVFLMIYLFMPRYTKLLSQWMLAE